MLTFSYTIFPTTKQQIERIEKIRNSTLLVLISPQKETELRLDALAKKAASSLFLSGKSINDDEIKSIIRFGKKNANANIVMEYKQAADYIRHNWYLSDDEIKGSALLSLLENYSGVKVKDRRQLDQAVSFITVNPEHGIIQAALAFVLIHNLLPDDNNNIRLSSNVSEVFLYKHGFDFRGLLNLDQYWADDLTNLKKILKSNIDVKNVSQFLEYFVAAVEIQAEKALNTLTEAKTKKSNPDLYFALGERQKKILSLFDIPNAKITNRDVQKAYNVSQITASRDLSQLSTLGYILPGGRGRSVFYTKI